MWQFSAPFWAWALASVLLGLGFTFFSGAVEAWLVDALKAHGYEGGIDPVFARGDGRRGGDARRLCCRRLIAQATNLGVPFLMRAGALVVISRWPFADARRRVHPEARRRPAAAGDGAAPGCASIRDAEPSVRWVMIASAFTDGVSIYGFYAMQPYLLDLYGDPRAYGVAGLSAAIVGGAQIAGGLLVSRLSRVVRRRTTWLQAAVMASGAVLLLIGLVPRFPFAVGLLVLWGLVFATVTPVRQAYLNDLIPSTQRATGLSLDSLMGSCGGVIAQPLLGRTADVWGYPASYVGCAPDPADGGAVHLAGPT